MVNHLGIYAHTTKVEVLVTDESGNPVPDAEVNFEVLNYGMFGKIATVRTGEDGRRLWKQVWEVCMSQPRQTELTANC